MTITEANSVEHRPSLILTNDDGWDAPGLGALWHAARGIGSCQIIAPSGPVSGCGHRVTTHAPLVVARPSEGFVSVAGTPADCVRLALHHLAPGPAWVFSGINAGGNLGTDIHYSGTVAAVREAVIHGVPGIALSQYLARRRAVDWDRTARWAEAVLRLLMARPWEAGTFWNVNFPHLTPEDADPEVVFCPLDPSPLPLNFQLQGDEAVYSGDYQSRGRRPGSDVDTCFGGKIAVTLIRIAGDGSDGPDAVSPGLVDSRVT